MNCSKCGAQNIDGVTFCGSCGARMESFIQQTPETPQQNFQNEGVINQPPPPPPPQYQQQPYGGSQSGGYNNTQGGSYSSPGGIPSNGGMIPPKNYMVESIVVTIVSTLCCCSIISIILGIIAIIKANNVNSEFERGNINEANSCSDSAKKLALWAGIIAIINVLIGWISYFIFFAAAIAENGGFDALFNNM